MNLTDAQPWPSGTAPAEELCEEDQRLGILASFDAETLAGDAELARITQFAAQLCGGKSSAVSLVESERQRFLAGEGLKREETPRSTSLCAHTMFSVELLEVLDASEDARFADFALVQGEDNLRYYVGAPLISQEGAPLGALCVTDTEPHTEPLTDLQRQGLSVLAEAVMRRLQSHREANAADSEIKDSAARLQFMLDSVPDIAWSAGAGPNFDFFNARFEEVTGCDPSSNENVWLKVIHPEDYPDSFEKFRVKMGRAEPFEDECRLRLADGSYRWIISRAVPSDSNPQTARWFGTLTDIHDRYQISEERELLAGELAHRIKNIFSVITGLVSLHARGEPGARAFADTLMAHIRALSRAQEFAIAASSDGKESLSDLLKVLMAPYGVPGQSAVAITGDKVAVGAKAATPLALVFHELATNSAKYGALSVATGTVNLLIASRGGDVRIDWSEEGGPRTSPPEDTGFGSRLVRLAVENQLGGSIEQDWAAEGLRTNITIPATRLAP